MNSGWFIHTMGLAVEHVAHVDVAGVVAKLRGEKASADLRRVADGQVRRLFALRTHRQRDFSDGRRGFRSAPLPPAALTETMAASRALK